MTYQVIFLLVEKKIIVKNMLEKGKFKSGTFQMLELSKAATDSHTHTVLPVTLENKKKSNGCTAHHIC